MTCELSSILIIKLSAIGDVVQSLPLLSVLRENFPAARIDWLVEEEASEIIKGHPAVNRVFISHRKSWQKKISKGTAYSSVIRETFRFIKNLRSCRYDLVIDLQGLFKSGILTGLSRGKRKIGLAGAREGGWLFLSERPVAVDYQKHAIDLYLKFAEYLGCGFTSWNGNIPVSQNDKGMIDQVLDKDGNKKRPLVVINPMAKWKTKLWERERFALLADRLQDDLSCKVFFTGSRHDRPIIEDITRMMKKEPGNLAGRTGLKELAYLFTRSKVVVTTDTGPMHIAAAMGCPVVALFGPTAPWRTGPYGQGHKVIRAEMECSPCFKKKCDHMTCMKEIKVEEVFEATKGIILRDHHVNKY
jgi:heptosyltransferase-1